MKDEFASLTFEAAYAALETTLAQLESGALALDESVALYERGRALAAHCQHLLDAAELRVSKLNDNGTTLPL